jgi:hypothetical protein
MTNRNCRQPGYALTKYENKVMSPKMMVVYINAFFCDIYNYFSGNKVIDLFKYFDK